MRHRRPGDGVGARRRRQRPSRVDGAESFQTVGERAQVGQRRPTTHGGAAARRPGGAAVAGRRRAGRNVEHGGRVAGTQKDVAGRRRLALGVQRTVVARA